MKKFIFVLVAIATLSIGSVSAQSQSIGGNLNVNFDGGTVGIGARYTTALGSFRLAPELGLFFPEVGSLIDMNANVHYLFPLGDRVDVYPLAGFNFGIFSYKGNSDSDFGLNLGAGVQYDFSTKIFGYAELKGVIGDGSRAQLSLGVAWKF